MDYNELSLEELRWHESEIGHLLDLSRGNPLMETQYESRLDDIRKCIADKPQQGARQMTPAPRRFTREEIEGVAGHLERCRIHDDEQPHVAEMLRQLLADCDAVDSLRAKVGAGEGGKAADQIGDANEMVPQGNEVVGHACDLCDDPVHSYFGLSYSNYQVITRSIAQSMPIDWQRRFVRCMEEIDAAASRLPNLPDSFEVLAKFGCDEDAVVGEDHWSNYQRGRRNVFEEAGIAPPVVDSCDAKPLSEHENFAAFEERICAALEMKPTGNNVHWLMEIGDIKAGRKTLSGTMHVDAARRWATRAAEIAAAAIARYDYDARQNGMASMSLQEFAEDYAKDDPALFPASVAKYKIAAAAAVRRAREEQP